MTKVFDIATIDVEEGFDGSLDELIDRLIAYRDIADKKRLTNVRVYTDYYDDEGREWKLFIMGNEPPMREPKLPPEQYKRIFQMGEDAARAGLVATSPYSEAPRNDIWNEPWYAGYKSVKV